MEDNIDNNNQLWGEEGDFAVHASVCEDFDREQFRATWAQKWGP